VFKRIFGVFELTKRVWWLQISSYFG